MTLSPNELAPSTKRVYTRHEKSALNAKLYWIDFYGIQEVDEFYTELFKGIDVKDEYAILDKWEEYLSQTLKFPFETKVTETDRGGLKIGTKIKLLDLDGYDDKYGIFGIGKGEMGAITSPICNLEATDKESKNYELLRNYVVWFANR